MKEINQRFLCITDHGVMGAIPQQIAECDKHKLFPLFGIEFYINPMQPKVSCRDESAEFRRSLGDGSKNTTPEQRKFDKSHHLLAIAYNNVGYSNLVRLSSWAWIHGYYRKPRINHEILMKHKEGIIFTSTCGNSEIANAFMGRDNGGENGFNEAAGFAMIEKYMAMFGEHFYLELMMLDWKMQKPYDAFLIRAHEKYHIPLMISQDCFVKGTMVLTNNSFKKIEDVVVGDVVLTHQNRWRKVEAVGSRAVKSEEKVFRVKTNSGTYAYEATGNHEVYVAHQRDGGWDFEWKETQFLTPKKDFLLIPKIKPDSVFSSEPLEFIDIMKFISDDQYQAGSSKKGNMSCKLQYNEESKEFWSYRGWDKKFKTTIPRYIKIDNDFLKMLGWYIAKGWSEVKSNHVGFALHVDEQPIADWLIGYFQKFGIIAKTYKVSNQGIAVGFSSIVFNKFLGGMCGYGSNNKHLPRPEKNTWMKMWNKEQLMLILSCYCHGHGSSKSTHFASTSKVIIHEICTVLNALGVFSHPACKLGRQKNRKDKWHLSVCDNKTTCIKEWFTEATNVNGSDVARTNGLKYFELENYYAISVKSLQEIQYTEDVFCFQVEEDHSFTSNLYCVSNCHYCKKEQSHNQRLMLMRQNKLTLADIEKLIQSGEADDIFELQDENLWLKSEDELNEKWESDYKEVIDYELYKQAKANTVKICEFAKGVQLDREIKLPKIPDAEALLWEEVLKGFVRRNCPKESKYIKQVREEYELIVEKGFASYFLIQKMMTDEARRIAPEILGFGDGTEAVGPGRGCTKFTQVHTRSRGSVDVSEVKIGDEVITQDGTFHKVTKTFAYPLKPNEPMLTVKSFYGDQKGVTLTLDHKILIEKSGADSAQPNGKNLQWTQAKDVAVGDWVFTPIPNVEIKTTLLDESHLLDENWARVLGEFAAVGCPSDKCVDFCFPSKEKQNNKWVEEFFKNLGCEVELCEVKQIEILSVNNKSMQLLFKSLFDKYECTAQTKHVPNCIIQAEENIVQAFLQGYFLADGTEDKHEMKFVTVSFLLANQIRFLLLRLGIPSTLQVDDRNIAYEIVCPLDDRICSRKYQKQYGWKRIEGGILTQVRSIKEIQTTGDVYDFEVEDNHNYLTSSFLVHNSVCGSLLAYCLRLHDLDPIRHGLRFSRFLSPARGGKQTKFRHTIEPIPHEVVNL